MTDVNEPKKRPEVAKMVQGVKLRGKDKMSRNPIKVPMTEELPKKPDWLRVKVPISPQVAKIKSILRKHQLASVCEEAQCPNLAECWGGGTATFMIMGEICTRRCPFCDVAHGRPNSLNKDEPRELAEAIADMDLTYVVVTSVDRDDLKDGGAQHFAECISEMRKRCPDLFIEVLVPDFRGRMDIALDILETTPPDVFNHNLESVPSLYRRIRPGADYQWSLELLKRYKERVPEVITKSGLMMGLGETKEEIIQVMKDLRAHNVDMLTIGQYLQPSRYHLPVDRFVPPEEFQELEKIAYELGFSSAACGPLVRSSYHADKQVDLERLKGIKQANLEKLKA